MSDCGVLQRVLTELATKARHARQQWVVIIRRGVTAALFSCYMAGAKWNCCPRQSGRRVRYTTMIQPCTHTPSFAFRHLPPPNPTAACPDQYRPLSLEIACSVTFEPDEFVLKIINSASAKSCEPHPIPTTLLYENLDILLPTITVRTSSTHPSRLQPLEYHVIWRLPASPHGHTSVKKAITWQKSFEKLPPHF